MVNKEECIHCEMWTWHTVSEI